MFFVSAIGNTPFELGVGMPQFPPPQIACTETFGPAPSLPHYLYVDHRPLIWG